MSRASRGLKRTVRIATARLPRPTRRAMLRAEWTRRDEDLPVPVGDGTAWIAAATRQVDHFTLYGSLIDGHFPCEVNGATVLDVGAHKGYFALRCFADGAARVHSYEPASQNLVSLDRSAADNESWRVVRAAVGAEAGTVELHLSPGSWGHSVHTPVGGESVGTEEVPMVALSTALGDASAPGDPVVAKINVEGAAGSMILGTEPDDWRAVRLLWADVEANDPVGLPRIVQHLDSCGLTHQRSDGARNLFAARGSDEETALFDGAAE